MKRTVPLLITGIVGFVLIVSFFIPATEGWGEVAAVWFDILAAIAFVLGGGNLMKIHLKKVSDRARGWAYSVITLAAFLAMLICGLLKISSPPAIIQEYYGQTFVEYPLSDLPVVFTVAGSIPDKEADGILPASVRAQLSADEQAGTVSFRGWMRPNQKEDLLGYKNDLDWQCTIERLGELAVPPKPLAGKINYYADHSALAFTGYMTDEHYEALLGISEDATWRNAVEALRTQAIIEHATPVQAIPPGLSIPDELPPGMTFDEAGQRLVITGPMTAKVRDTLADQFPMARPLGAAARESLLSDIESFGSLSSEQTTAFHKVLDGIWTPEQLTLVLNEAGRGEAPDRKACEMLADHEAGATTIEPKGPVPADVTLNSAQGAVLQRFADDVTMTAEELVEELKQQGEFTDRQVDAMDSFFGRQSTIGERNKAVGLVMLRQGPLSDAQQEYLFAAYRGEQAWARSVQDLFRMSHQVKYPWSGTYRAYGTPFWWLYEYAFKPLTATMFAMLAFYVASAAFRAFRAKNIEAILLLGTAFIILLGRTFAGVWLTSWIDPDGPLAGLRIENLTVTIMNVFNTAGTRGIMIGIALGIASTSLKVLLGVDRSYLGKE